MYFPTYALHNSIYTTHIKTPTCFSSQVPSSGSYYNKGVQANLLIYALFVVLSLIKSVVIHKMYKIYKNLYY